jgi:protein TonB
MNTKSLVLAALLVGGLAVSASALTTSAVTQIQAPAPIKVVSPTDLPRSFAGKTVRVSMIIDAAGQPHDIKVVAVQDRNLTRSLVAAVSQWQFSPARKDGLAVASTIVLPIELEEEHL